LAGSHRAPRTNRSAAVPLWAIVVAIVIALIPATWFTAQRVFDGSESPGRDTTTQQPIPPVSPRTTPTPTATPATTPPASAPSTTAPVRLPRVAAEAPRRLVVRGLIDVGFDNAVTTIETGSTAEVARLEARGSPGSPGTDTVYVIGKVFPGGTGSAFAKLPKLVVGTKVTIRTDAGVLTYTVRSTGLTADAHLRKAPVFTQHRAGRLVLVGIRYNASGDELPKDLVVTAQLTGAKRS
jgi:hypothetical protein